MLQTLRARALIAPLRLLDDGLWTWCRTSGVRPGSDVGHALFAASQAIRSAESMARRFPIDPSGL